VFSLYTLLVPEELRRMPRVYYTDYSSVRNKCALRGFVSLRLVSIVFLLSVDCGLITERTGDFLIGYRIV